MSTNAVRRTVDDDVLGFGGPSLPDLGWDPVFASVLDNCDRENCLAARVVRDERHVYLTYGKHGELRAEVSGRFRNLTQSRADFPVVGDWVALEPRPESSVGIIHAVAPRRSQLSRRSIVAAQSELTEEQVLAANIDTAFLVAALDGGRNFNLQRLERYLTLAWDSGAAPVIVLNIVC